MDITAIARACSVFGGASALAAKLGVTVGAIHQWRGGQRPIPIERCVEIEHLTAGEVSRIHLRPNDWHRIWPELAAMHPERVPAEPTGPAAAPEPAKVER